MRGPILIPHPTSRRGVPRGRPSLTFTPAPSPHPYPLSSRMRGPILRPSTFAFPHVGASLVGLPFPDIHGPGNPSPHPYPLSSRMRGPILAPHPTSRRGVPRGAPSLSPSLRHSRVEPTPVNTKGREPILIPHPTSRRSVPRGRPSLTFTPSPSPHPSHSPRGCGDPSVVLPPSPPSVFPA